MNHDEDEAPRIQLTSMRFEMSTKLTALTKHITSIMVNTDEKIIVFTQWSSMLDLIQVALKSKSISFTRMDGSMSANQRKKALTEFKQSSRVLIATLRSTGVGLNLTMASRAFLVDPWWNESVESQYMN